MPISLILLLQMGGASYCILHFVFLVIDNAAIKPLSLSSNIATVSKEVDLETIESTKSI